MQHSSAATSPRAGTSASASGPPPPAPMLSVADADMDSLDLQHGDAAAASASRGSGSPGPITAYRATHHAGKNDKAYFKCMQDQKKKGVAMADGRESNFTLVPVNWREVVVQVQEDGVIKFTSQFVEMVYKADAIAADWRDTSSMEDGAVIRKDPPADASLFGSGNLRLMLSPLQLLNPKARKRAEGRSTQSFTIKTADQLRELRGCGQKLGAKVVTPTVGVREATGGAGLRKGLG